MPTAITGPYLATINGTYFYCCKIEGAENWAQPTGEVFTQPGVPGFGIHENGFTGEPFMLNVTIPVSAEQYAYEALALLRANVYEFFSICRGGAYYMTYAVLTGIANTNIQKTGGGAGTFGLGYTMASNPWHLTASLTFQHGATTI